MYMLIHVTEAAAQFRQNEGCLGMALSMALLVLFIVCYRSRVGHRVRPARFRGLRGARARRGGRLCPSSRKRASLPPCRDGATSALPAHERGARPVAGP